MSPNIYNETDKYDIFNAFQEEYCVPLSGFSWCVSLAVLAITNFGDLQMALKHQCKANQFLDSFQYKQSHATVVIMIKTYNRLITWLPLFCTQPNQKSTAEF